MADNKVTAAIATVLSQHSARAGIMASPTHWAYRGDWIYNNAGKPWMPDRNREIETPGHWYAHCGVGNGDPGCGWEHKGETFETKEQAREVALLHVAEMVAEVLND